MFIASMTVRYAPQRGATSQLTDGTRARDEHCTPLGCGREPPVSINIAPRWGA